MAFEYGVAKYTIRDAAVASGFQLNTLRSLYGRGHFKIIGGEDQKGRGLAAEMTLEDLLCISVAKAAIDAGVHPALAFEAGVHFAHFSGGAVGPNTGERLPAHLFPAGFTVLVMHPAIRSANIINVTNSIEFADLFTSYGTLGRHAAVVVLLNDVVRSVLSRLGAFEQLATAE